MKDAMNYTQKSARISECGTYRYELTRRWGWGPMCGWLMLNPSTADADKDDPTIRRCVGFARSWGFGGIRIYNLFAQRSSDPRALLRHLDPVGPANMEAIDRGAGICHTLVCAWGASGGDIAKRQASEVLSMLAGCPLDCLGLTASGAPRHPLYVKSDTRFMVYRGK